jgi:hypothetical protein
MFLRTKSQNKKANLIAQFVVLLVIAVILILVVTSFGVKIWSSFFPNSDISTLKSFEMLYQVINAKSVATDIDYDYTPINIYMKENYRILFFEKDKLNCGQLSILVISGGTAGATVTSSTPTEIIYNRPTTCEDEQCICLYKNEPSQIEKDRDKYVVKCHKLTRNIDFEPLTPPTNLDAHKLFEINDKSCEVVTGLRTASATTNTEYSSYLIIKYNEYEDTGKSTPRVFILEDSEDNRRLNNELSIPRCSVSTDPLISMCNGKIDGVIIEPNEQEKLDIISKECETTQTKKSTGIECKFTNDKINRICSVNCIDESSTICKNINSDNKDKCEIYNQLEGVYDLKYITKEYNYKYTYMCLNDAKYCNAITPNTCEVIPLEVYADPKDSEGGYTPKSNLEPGSKEAKIQSCIGDKFIIKGNKWFVKSYDATNSDCDENLIKIYFYPKRQVYACNPENIQKCKQTIDENTGINCELRYIKDANKYWITYYKDDETCLDTLTDKTIFLPVNLCTQVISSTATP